jgi:hypothetical protein
MLRSTLNINLPSLIPSTSYYVPASAPTFASTLLYTPVYTFLVNDTYIFKVDVPVTILNNRASSSTYTCVHTERRAKEKSGGYRERI